MTEPSDKGPSKAAQEIEQAIADSPRCCVEEPDGIIARLVDEKLAAEREAVDRLMMLAGHPGPQYMKSDGFCCEVGEAIAAVRRCRE